MRALPAVMSVCAALLCACRCGALEPRIAVVGSDVADLGPILSSLQLAAVPALSLAEVPEGVGAVLVLACAYPRPTELSAGDVGRLEAMAASGVGVYLEYPSCSGPCFGASVGSEPKRAVHQRLVALRPFGELKPEDLLDEHDGAYVPLTALPAGSDTLLEYDLAYGTYDRIARPDNSAFSLTVDLGTVRRLTAVGQRYGAGQPNYRPESVELWLSQDGESFSRAGRMAGAPMPGTVQFDTGGASARYVRLVARKWRRSPVTDFFFMGEVEVVDAEGANVALGAAYALQSECEQSAAYRDNGSKLTDGRIEGLYSDGLSVGWGTAAPEETTFPGLVRIQWGKGAVLLSAPRISDFAARNFRPVARWEALWRHILLELLPAESREQMASRYVPLEAHTEPRVWATPGTQVRLVVRSAPDARVTAASSQHGALRLEQGEDGALRAGFTATPGTHSIDVRSETEQGTARRVVTFDCRSREEKYREALDRNMAWFLRSGVLPAQDGSEGIISQVCMAWLDSGLKDPLGSPFRVDCNAMSAQALYLYGMLSGDERYRTIARNIADTVLAHQYTDPALPSLGGFPWLYENSDTIYFWDDNSRIGDALLWLYHWTGEERYLRGALLGAELFRQVAREDGCVHRHAISKGDLDRIGREAYRQYSDGTDVDYRLAHWWTLAAVTGGETYGRLAETTSRTWLGHAGIEGSAYVARYRGDAAGEHLRKLAESFLSSPMVVRHGMVTTHGGEYQRAFTGDCGIATRDGEPLTDQIYGTPWVFRAGVRAWRATGDETCRRLCETVGDYLVRIQFRHEDPRLDGCWMRGFDVEQWDYFGAPYDPQYGPYSAYTGWMNSVASSAFAWYLMEADPFIPTGAHPQAAELAAEVRRLSPPQVSERENVALGCPYVVSDGASEAYRDDGRKLTDGVADGHYGDKQSVGWYLPQESSGSGDGVGMHVVVTLDLERARSLKLITQTYGAGVGAYNPDLVRVSLSRDGGEFTDVAQSPIEGRGGGLLWLVLPGPVEARFVRFELSKRRRGPTSDFLFVGEIRAYEEP